MSQQLFVFKEFVEQNFDKLDLFTTAITRAHGKSHPETFEVRNLFESIHAKVNETDTNIPKLDEQFNELQNITKNYTVPEDVCETYVSVYEMLARLDQLYHAI